MEKYISYLIIIIILVSIVITSQNVLENFVSIDNLQNDINSIKFDSVNDVDKLYSNAEYDLQGKLLEKKATYLNNYSNYLYPPQASNGENKYNLIYNLVSPSLFEYNIQNVINETTAQLVLLTNDKCISSNNTLENCNTENKDINLTVSVINNEMDYNNKIDDEKYKISNFKNINGGKNFVAISPLDDAKKCLTIDDNNKIGFEPCNFEINQKWYLKK